MANAGEVRWSVGELVDVNGLLAENHYLGAVRSGGAALVVVGRVGSEVVAAQVWRKPTSRRLPSDGSWLELSRWCLTPAAGANAGSRCHAAAVRLIRAHFPAASWLVSYSDPGHGHTGALYRSCNWRWAPTWHRLRPPPTGNGNWKTRSTQGVKDRWVFPIRRRGPIDLLRVNDPGAIRRWLSGDPNIDLALRSLSPDLVEAAAAARQLDAV